MTSLGRKLGPAYAGSSACTGGARLMQVVREAGIPEPSALALLALGGIALPRRRRR
jgi:PEP-CTERM motif